MSAPPELWAENGSERGNSVGDKWEINDFAAVILRDSGEGDGVDEGTADPQALAPIPFYVSTLELDLGHSSANLVPTTDYAASELTLFHGLPGTWGTNGRVYSTDVYDWVSPESGLQFTPDGLAWSGMSTRLRWKIISGTPSTYHMIARTVAFLSSTAPGADDPVGWMLPAFFDKTEIQFDNAADMQQIHSIEFGRQSLSEGQKFRQAFKFYKGVAAKDLRSSLTPDIIHTWDIGVGDVITSGGAPYYHRLPDFPTQNSRGGWGMYGKVTRSGTDTAIGINEIKVAYNFR